MKNLFMTKDGFIPLENLITFNVFTIITTLVGFPLMSLFVAPGLLLTTLASAFNAYRHWTGKANDPLCIDVFSSKAVKEFDLTTANECSILKFFGQIARLVTPAGTLFDYGSKASLRSSGIALFGGFGRDCGHSSGCGCGGH